MNRATNLVALAALAVLAIGLGGCRSSGCNTCAAPSQTAPAPAAPDYDYYGPGGGTAAVPEVPSGPPLATMPPPGSDFGSPDGMPGDAVIVDRRPVPGPGMPQPGGSTSRLSTVGGGTSDVGAQVRAAEEARGEAEQRLERLRARVAALREDVNPESFAPAVDAGPSRPMSAGAGEMRAARFAADLRARADAEIAQNGSTVIIRLTDAFQAGSDKLKGDPELRTVLMSTASALADASGVEIRVVGHSDGDPITKSDWPDNVTLSRARASTVAQALAKQGLPSSRLVVDGRGSHEPLVYPESSKTDKARNRRVEIHVLF